MHYWDDECKTLLPVYDIFGRRSQWGEKRQQGSNEVSTGSFFEKLWWKIAQLIWLWWKFILLTMHGRPRAIPADHILQSALHLTHKTRGSTLYKNARLSITLPPGNFLQKRINLKKTFKHQIFWSVRHSPQRTVSFLHLSTGLGTQCSREKWGAKVIIDM